MSLNVDARTINLDEVSDVSLDVSVSNDDDSGAVAALEIIAKNTGSSLKFVSAGPPRPFGVLVASERGSSTSGITLWSERYRESEDVMVEDQRVVGRRKVEVGTGLEPGDSVSAVYQLSEDVAGLDGSPTAITPGTYVLQDADGQLFEVGGYGIELDVSE